MLTREEAIVAADRLLGQLKVSIVFPDETVMLEGRGDN